MRCYSQHRAPGFCDTHRAPAPILYVVSPGQDIPDDVILELAQHKNFLGVKECTGVMGCATSLRCTHLPWGVARVAKPGWQLGPLLLAGNARIEKYHNAGVLCWSGNDDEAHAGRHQHHAQVRTVCPCLQRVPAFAGQSIHGTSQRHLQSFAGRHQCDQQHHPRPDGWADGRGEGCHLSTAGTAAGCLTLVCF